MLMLSHPSGSRFIDDIASLALRFPEGPKGWTLARIKRRFCRAIAVLSLTLVGSAHGYAADGGTRDVFGSWSSLTLSGNFEGISPDFQRFRWLVMDQVRTRDDSPAGTRFSENLVWAQLGYDISEYASVWLGYTHAWIDPLDKPSAQESRPYQDLLLNIPFLSGRLMSRTRLEQRINPSGGDVGIRARQWIQYSHPLPVISEKLSVFAGDEVLAYFNDSPFGVNGFSENRVLAGVSYQFTGHLGVDLGYLGQYVVNKAGPDLFTHNLWANLRYQF